MNRILTWVMAAFLILSPCTSSVAKDTGDINVRGAVVQSGAAKNSFASNVGINSTLPPGKLTVDGTIYVSNTTVLPGHGICRTYTGFIGHCSTTLDAAGLCTCIQP